MAMTSRNDSALRTFLTLSTSVAALLATPALAQQAEEAATDVGDIVVTAQFREQKLQDTPLAITAVDAATIESRSQTSLAEVVKQAPSVVLLPATAAFGPSISASIRGLGQNDFNPALEPGVGLYIDDVYYPRLTGANFDLLDVERVHLFVVGRIPFLLHPEWKAEKGGTRLWRVTDWGMGIFVDSARSF